MTDFEGTDGDEPVPGARSRRRASEFLSLNDDPLLTISEVALIFRVSPKTVSRWESGGKLQAVRTLGGHRRFRTSEVRAALAASTGDDIEV